MIDLRSDACGRPTADMRTAMAIPSSATTSMVTPRSQGAGAHRPGWSLCRSAC